MNDRDLQSLWQAEASGLPSAFTVAELAQASPRPPAEEKRAAAIFHQSVPFLRSLLVMRLRAQRMKLYGTAAMVPVALVFIPLAFTGQRWLLPVMLGVIVLAIIRQLGRALRIDRSLGALRDDQGAGGSHPRLSAQRPVQLGLIMLLSGLTLVAGLGYVVWGEHRAQELRVREAAQCEEVLPTDVARAVSACEKVLRRRPDHVEAAAALRRHRVHLRCLEKLSFARQLISRGSPELALAELDGLGADCPNVVVQSASTEAAPLVSPVTSAAHLDCLRAVKGEQWGDALERCGVYARYACRGKPPHWQATDEAFQGLLRARARLVPSSAATWQCPESAVLGPP